MNSKHLTVAIMAAIAVAGCHNPDPTKRTTMTTQKTTPATDPAATTMASAPPATDATPAGGDLHNADPTASKSTAAPAKP